MKTPSTRLLMLNVAAILVGLAAVAAVIRSFVVTPATTPCSERYVTTMVFPLERDGLVLSATDIHARTGGGDASGLENLEIIRLRKGPATAAMSVSLPKGAAAPNSGASPKGGVSFPWQPRALREQSSVCLSYQVQLPGDFDFNLGGQLPGIAGRSDQSDDRFLVQAGWRQGGVIGASNFVMLGGKKWKQVAEGDGPAIARGRWVRIDQEVVLNAPDQENGILRIWVDGALALDKSDFVYRNKPGVGLTGVAADVFYSGEDVAARSPADATVLLTPFEIRWQ